MAVSCGPCPLGTEMVTNGNFSNPSTCYYTQFTSDYSFTCNTLIGTGNGAFTITANATGMISQWTGTSHTADGSRVMFGRFNSTPQKVWYQNISVVSGKTYCFNAWFRGGCMGCVPISVPTMKIGITNSGILTTIDTQTDSAWHQLSGIYTATTTGTVELDVYAMGTIGKAGTYFDLDDISFKQQLIPDPGFIYTNAHCNQITKFFCNDSSAGYIHSWNFGDGTTSSLPNPTHMYTSETTYTVTHNVTNPCGIFTSSQTVNVTCCCKVCKPSVVIDGDFSQLDCPTSTYPAPYYSELADLGCTTTSWPSTDQGYYRETANSSVTGLNANWKVKDHTKNGSKFILIDGPTIAQGNKKAWKQYVQHLKKAKWYCYTAWVKNVCYQSCPYNPSFSLIVTSMTPPGTPVTVDNVNSLPYYDDTTWTKLCGTYYSTDTQTVELSVLIKGGAALGNDGAIDDISFSEQSLPDPSYYWQIAHCGQVSKFYGIDNISTTQYKWFVDGVQVSTSINMTATFTEGSHTVKYTVTNGCGSVDSIITFNVTCCCGNSCKPNVVVNGDFSSSTCKYSYSSGINYLSCSPVNSSLWGPLMQNYFTESNGHNASVWNSTWLAGDHSQNGSRFMLIDGPKPGDGTRKAWIQNTTVKRLKTYCFNAWVKNVCSTCGLAPGGYTPSFILRVRSITNGDSVDVDHIDNLKFSSDTLDWFKLCGTYYSTSNQTLELSIVMKEGQGNGNDGAIDDISFSEQSKPDSSFIAYPAHCGDYSRFFANDQVNTTRHKWKVNHKFTSGDTLTSFAKIFTAGSDTITLVVTNSCGTDSMSQVINVSCCCTVCRPSLLLNGDFSAACQTDYTSDLHYVTCSNGSGNSLGGAGNYSETTNPAGWGSWHGGDHSGNGSKVLIVDGPTTSDASVWKKTVTVIPGHNYCFSAYVKGACNCAYGPIFKLKISGTGVTTTFPDSAKDLEDPDNWTKMCGTFTVPTGITSLNLAVVITKGQSGGAGNDGMLDDIIFSDQSKPDVSFNASVSHCGQTSWFMATDTFSNTTNTWKVDNVAIGTGRIISYALSIGVHTIKHIVTNGCGSDSLSKSFSITCCSHPCRPNLVTSSMPVTYSPGSSTGHDTAFKQIVNVRYGYAHYFSVWVKNNCSTCTTNPTFRLYLKGLSDGQLRLVDTLGYLPYASGSNWIKMCGTYIPTSTQRVSLTVVVAGMTSGYQVVMDTIIFSEQSTVVSAFHNTDADCGTAMQFIGTDFATYINQLWRFGDGSTSTAANPTHIYSGNGRFIVTHITSNLCGTDSTRKLIYMRCCCTPCGNNIVANGDFSNTGCRVKYNSDLTQHACTNGGTLYTSQFTEDTGSTNWQAGDHNPWHGSDHTGILGSKFMIINGPLSSDKRVWYQMVHIDKGKTYCFSAHVKTLCNTCHVMPGFQLMVDGLCGTIIDTLNNLQDASSWAKLCGTFIATYTGPIELDVVMHGISDSIGNDAGLDDISFAQTCCSPPNISADFTISSCTKCNSSVTFRSKNSTGHHNWDFGDGNTVYDNANPDHTYSPSSTGYMIVTHTVTSGCRSETKTMKIVVNTCP